MSGIRSEQIYEALLDDEALNRLPQLLAQCAGGTTALLHWRFKDAPSEVASFWNFRIEDMRQYASKWQSEDLWFAESLKPRMLNKMHLWHEIVPESKLVNSIAYNEFCRTQLNDLFYCLGGTFATPWGAGSIGIHRFRDNEPFDNADLERLRPHTAAVGHVLKVRGEIAAARHACARAQATLDTLSTAIFTARADGRIVSANAVGGTIIARDDGLVARNGNLAALHQDDDAALERAIGAAGARSSPRASAVAIRRRGDRPSYLITVAPLVGRGRMEGVMLVFNDPDAKTIDLARHLHELFGLTRAESEVAVRLSDGHSAKEIARERDVSLNTLNTQLKSIMAKMGCTRQAEIAARIAALPRVRHPKTECSSAAASAQTFLRRS